MSDFHGKATISIDGEEIGEVKDIEIEPLSDKEIYGVERKECDHCGNLIAPPNMVIVGGTDGDKVGVYHIDCKP